MGYGSGLPNIFPNLTFQCNPQVQKVVDTMPADALMLDLGAGGRRIHPNIKTVDMVDTGNTDYVSDVTAVPLANHSTDLIIATGLLEHVRNEHHLLLECARLLKPGGTLHIEVPFLQQYHDDPIDMRRYTVSGLKEFVSRYGFDVTASDFHIGPSVTVVTLNAYYASLLFDGKNVLARALSYSAFMLVSILGYPFKFLDNFLKNKKSAQRLAFGVFVTAKKRK